MTRALLRKELQQHWLIFLFLALAAFTGFVLVIAANAARGQTGTPYEGFRWFAMVIATLVSFVLGSRLVTTEYQSRTQLFLEALPLARWHMVLVKYALGLSVIVVLTATAWLLSVGLISTRAAPDARLACFVLVRALAAVWCVYSFFFMMGLLGRYRLALYILAFLFFGLLSEHSDFQVGRFGPFALLNERFAFERDHIPPLPLAQTTALACLFIGMALLLSLTREGSVAALLAQRMSHREKVFTAALLIGVAWAGALLTEKTKKTPFDLQDAVEARRGKVTVKIASTSDQQARISELASNVAEELEAARVYLGRSEFPPVFLTHRSDLRPDRFERGELENAEGVIAQANVVAALDRPGPLMTWLLREALIVASHGRAKLEPRRWVLDGFPHFWTTRGSTNSGYPLDGTLALRACYGTQSGFSEKDWDAWLTFRERVGDDIAGAVAWAGLRVLEHRQTPQKCRAFLQSILGVPWHADFRASLGRLAQPATDALMENTGLDAPNFTRLFRQELNRTRVRLRPQLELVPLVRGTVQFEPVSAISRRVRYQAAITPAITGIPTYAFLHTQLLPVNEEVELFDVRREEHPCTAADLQELPETVSRGQRLFYTFSLHANELDCEVISGWTRIEIP